MRLLGILSYTCSKTGGSERNLIPKCRLSDVRATILIKTIDVSPRVITVASYMKCMKLVSSEAAHSIVLGAKKIIQNNFEEFCAGFFKPKRLVVQKPVFLQKYST